MSIRPYRGTCYNDPEDSDSGEYIWEMYPGWCYLISYMGRERYIVPIENTGYWGQGRREGHEEPYLFRAYSGPNFPDGVEYLAWPEVSIILHKIDDVMDERDLSASDVESDSNGEEKRPAFLNKLKF